MAEADARHQREIEMAALQAAEKEVRRGQLFGFSLGLTALIASVLALYLGSETVASIIGGTTVVGLVSAFIIGRTKKSD